MHKLLILSSLILLSVAPYAQAQTIPGTQEGRKAILLNFMTIGSFTLNQYQGGFGAKYFIQNDLAVRGMLLFGTDNVTSKGLNASSTSTLNFGVAGALEYHLDPNPGISPYIGGSISYFNSGETSSTTGPGSYSTSATTTNFGVDALAGVEFFVGHNVSVSAEYQYGIRSSSSQGSSEFQFGFQTASLTMGIYF